MADITNVTNDVFMMEHLSDAGILRAERDYDESTADDFAKFVTAHRENRDAYRDAYEHGGDVTDKYLWVYAHSYVIRATALTKTYNEVVAQMSKERANFTVVGRGIFDTQTDTFNVTDVYDNERNRADDGGDG